MGALPLFSSVQRRSFSTHSPLWLSHKQHEMASLIPRTAFRAASTAAKSARDTSFVNKGAQRDPELYILLGVMSGAFGLAGFYFGRKPTSASSEADVSVANSSMPWEVDHEH